MPSLHDLMWPDGTGRKKSLAADSITTDYNMIDALLKRFVLVPSSVQDDDELDQFHIGTRALVQSLKDLIDCEHYTCELSGNIEEKCLETVQTMLERVTMEALQCSKIISLDFVHFLEKVRYTVGSFAAQALQSVYRSQQQHGISSSSSSRKRSSFESNVTADHLLAYQHYSPRDCRVLIVHRRNGGDDESAFHPNNQQQQQHHFSRQKLRWIRKMRISQLDKL
eukprot:PhM_4_TR10775/c0_g2_i1/m.60391